MQCARCERPLDDLDGCVVADKGRYAPPLSCVDELVTLCNACLREVPGLAERFHTLWELQWLQSRHVWVTHDMLDRLIGPDGRSRWTEAAVGQFVRLNGAIHPDRAGPPRNRLLDDPDIPDQSAGPR